MAQDIRHIPKRERTQELDCAKDESSSILSAELREAIRSFMRQELRRLRRDEIFMLRRGMKSEVESMERELGLVPE